MVKRFICFVLTMVLCFVFACSVGEGLLPSLSELEDVQMPSLGSVLHRYPDNETVNSDKSVEQFWYDVSNEDYIAFSNYLSTQDVQLKDYSVENNQITATIEKNGKVFFFTYIPDVKQAIVVYPAGTCDAREKEAAAHYNRAKELAEEEKYDEACEELCAIEDAAWYKDTAYLNTFTAPVFKGSVSVRSAAGQLVETACKSGRRKRPFFAEDAFSDVVRLYSLDSLSEAK